jgi:hypothetical protein
VGESGRRGASVRAADALHQVDPLGLIEALCMRDSGFGRVTGDIDIKRSYHPPEK